jgi:hypothetical protein
MSVSLPARGVRDGSVKNHRSSPESQLTSSLISNECDGARGRKRPDYTDAHNEHIISVSVEKYNRKTIK